MTKVLLDGDSVVDRMEVDTSPDGGGGLVFVAEGLILCRPGSSESVKEKLRKWSRAAGATKLDFTAA